MSDSFTFNFNGPVGQNIAKVDKMIVNMDKDGKIQVMNAGNIEMQNDQEPMEPITDEEIYALFDKPRAPKTIENRILAVFNSNLCKHDADWGVVFKLLIENKEFGFGPTEYERCAELINKTCGTDVTSSDSIRLSKANTSLGGTYKTGWRDTDPSTQTKSMLKRYNAIAAVFMQD